MNSLITVGHRVVYQKPAEPVYRDTGIRQGQVGTVMQVNNVAGSFATGVCWVLFDEPVKYNGSRPKNYTGSTWWQGRMELVPLGHLILHSQQDKPDQLEAGSGTAWKDQTLALRKELGDLTGALGIPAVLNATVSREQKLDRIAVLRDAEFKVGQFTEDWSAVVAALGFFGTATAEEVLDRIVDLRQPRTGGATGAGPETAPHDVLVGVIADDGRIVYTTEWAGMPAGSRLYFKGHGQ